MAYKYKYLNIDREKTSTISQKHAEDLFDMCLNAVRKYWACKISYLLILYEY